MRDRGMRILLTRSAATPLRSSAKCRFAFGFAKAGNATILFGLAVPVLAGVAGLAIDVGQWELAHKSLQRAADSAAISAAVAFASSGATTVTTEAKGIAANYNFVDGSGGTTVTVNRPPSSGAYTANTGAVEVIISQPQARMFSALFGNGTVAERGRAVAVGTSTACILALDQTAAKAISAQGNVSVTANGCSIFSNSNSSTSVSAGGSAIVSAMSIGAVGSVVGQSNMTTTNGVTSNQGTLADPYYGKISVPTFSGCDQTSFTAKTTTTISPGVYCGGFTLNAGANVTMSPGVYIMDQGAFVVNGSTTLTGTDVTIIFTSSSTTNYPTAKINGGANVNLTAPSTGPYAGVVVFGDPNMPVGTTFDLEGGSSQSINGVTYTPHGAISYAGGASGYSGCSEIVGDTVSFVGDSNLALNCSGMGTRKIGRAPQLVE